MEKFLYIDVNLLASLFLILIFIYNRKEIYTNSKQSRQLHDLILLNILNCFTEIAFFFTSFLGESTYINFFGTCTLFLKFLILNLMAFNYTKFIYIYIFKELYIKKSVLVISSIPSMINVILLIINLKTNFLYTIDYKSFGYITNWGFIIYLSIICSYLFFNIYILLKYQNKLSNVERTTLITTCLLASFGGIPQAITNAQIPTTSVTLSLANILILLFLHKKLVKYDALTGFWTRYKFEEIIVYLESQHIENFSIAIMDLKKLGYINKKYGFSKGNSILFKLHNILKKSITSKHIIARYRPNEFMILFFTKDLDSIKKDFNKIRENFDNTFKANYPQLDYYFYCESFNLNKYKTYSNFVRCIEKNLVEKNDLYITKTTDNPLSKN